jgi:hypothetical protein
VVRDSATTLGDVIRELKADVGEDERIHHDVVLIWINEPRIITGADILDRLLTGIGESGYV